MEVRRQIAIARAWLPLLIVAPLLAAVVAFGVASSQPQVYQVSAQMLPQQFLPGNPDYSTVSLSRALVLTTNFASIAKSRDLLSSIQTQLGDKDTLENFVKRVDATVDPNTAGLTITARAGDPVAAQAIANAVAHAIQAKSSDASNTASLLADMETVRTRMLAAESEYERLLALPTPRKTEDELALANSLATVRELTTVYDTLTASLGSGQDGLVVVDQAAAASALKIAPLALRDTLLAAVAALIIAAGIVSLLEYLDDRVKDPETIEAVTGLGTLGTLPRMKGDKGRSEIYRLATLLYPRSPAAEAYRTLRSNIEFAAVDAPIRTLLVTSAVPGEGKTITSANLAAVFAQAGRRVLLVDADLRKPGVHVAFNLPNARGLTTLIRGDELGLDDVALTTEQAGLRILTSGPLPPNPAELLGSHRMRTVLERLKSEVDLVILDSAPLRGLTDSAVLSSFVDGTVLVIDAGVSRRQVVRQCRQALEKADANVLGAILNRIPDKSRSSGEAYGYGYGSDPATEKPA